MGFFLQATAGELGHRDTVQRRTDGKGIRVACCAEGQDYRSAVCYWGGPEPWLLGKGWRWRCSACQPMLHGQSAGRALVVFTFGPLIVAIRFLAGGLVASRALCGHMFDVARVCVSGPMSTTCRCSTQTPGRETSRPGIQGGRDK